MASNVRSRLLLLNTLAKVDGPGGMWMTTRRAAGKSAGSPLIIFLTADITPAEPPITIMSCFVKWLTEYSGSAFRSAKRQTYFKHGSLSRSATLGSKCSPVIQQHDENSNHTDVIPLRNK